MAFIGAMLGLALLYLHNAEYRYTAEMVVTPADQSGGKTSASLAGLGSLVGADLSGQAGSAFALYSDAVSSYPVVESLARDPRIMHAAFRANWDDRTKTWLDRPSFLRSVFSGMEGVVGIRHRPWHIPDAQDLKAFIEKRLSVIEDKRKFTATLSFDDEDPAFAGYFLSQVNIASDAFLRQRALVRANTYIAYLEQRLSQVQIAEYRLSISQMLSSYERTRMMASSTASYAAEPFGSVWVSPVPTKPKPLIVIALAFLAGVAFWLAYVFVIRSGAEAAL